MSKEIINEVLAKQYSFSYQKLPSKKRLIKDLRIMETQYQNLIKRGKYDAEIFLNKLEGTMHAWKWGLENFPGSIDESIISQLATRINSNIQYPYISNEKKVQKEMRDLYMTVNSLESNLAKGLYSHFHIHRIHPIRDGNKRLSRTVQNLFFVSEGYVPIYPQTEKWKEYTKLLISPADADLDKYDPIIIQKEKKFYEFMCDRLENA